MSLVSHGEPYAGKLHVRFDEGVGVPCGGVPLYSTPQEMLGRRRGLSPQVNGGGRGGYGLMEGCVRRVES